VLQLADGLRVQQVIFAIHPEVISASDRQFRVRIRHRPESKLVLHLGLTGEHI
jgi:hypothetical protein